MLQHKKAILLGRILTLVVSLPFAMSSVMKLIQHTEVIKGVGHLGIPESLVLPLGMLELVCLCIYLLPQTALLGAILLTGYIGGAILTHLRIGEAVFMQVIIGILIWAAIYLREPHLREILPFRKKQKLLL